jgi:putative phosphoesterase
MKLGLVSDLHGDPLALELAWAHLTTTGVDRIVSAGDLVGYGPFPDRVVKFLEERHISSVRGNHDRWAIARGPGVPDEFGGGTPGPESLDFLRALSPHLLVECDSRIGLIAHGSPTSDMEFVTRRTHPPDLLDAWLADLRCDFLVVGHTHKPMWYRGRAGGLVVNPGSLVSMPVVDSSRTFAVVDTTQLDVTFHDVETGRQLELEPWS